MSGHPRRALLCSQGGVRVLAKWRLPEGLLATLQAQLCPPDVGGLHRPLGTCSPDRGRLCRRGRPHQAQPGLSPLA